MVNVFGVRRNLFVSDLVTEQVRLNFERLEMNSSRRWVQILLRSVRSTNLFDY